MRMRILEISVGAFILAGILALVGLALNVSGLTMSSKDDTYTVYARFENIGGLDCLPSTVSVRMPSAFLSSIPKHSSWGMESKSTNMDKEKSTTISFVRI